MSIAEEFGLLWRFAARIGDITMNDFTRREAEQLLGRRVAARSDLDLLGGDVPAGAVGLVTAILRDARESWAVVISFSELTEPLQEHLTRLAPFGWFGRSDFELFFVVLD